MSGNTSGFARYAELERDIWVALGGWLFRRPLRLPAGGRAFGYGKAAAPAIWVFIAISAFEIPLLDLLMPTWQWRVGVGLLGFWGLCWMLGLLALQHRRPHVAAGEWLRVRSGFALDVLVPWDVVASVRAAGQTVASAKSVQYQDIRWPDQSPSEDPDEPAFRPRLLLAPVSSRTNVTVMFRQPLEIIVRDRPEIVCGVQLWADDPAGLVTAVRDATAGPAPLLEAGAAQPVDGRLR